MNILALAYVADPDLGSEEGAGWIWARLLAGFADTWVITRPLAEDPSRIDALRRAMASAPEADRLHLVVVELPGWVRRLTVGGRRPKRLEYLIWQMLALRAARRLHRRVGLDLVWHVSWSAGWLGSIGWAVGPPFVLGPIGAGVRAPWRLIPSLGVTGAASEIVRSVLQATTPILNPLVRQSNRRAALILVQNRETMAWLPRVARSRAVVFSRVVLEDGPDVALPARTRDRAALFVGRLLPWKGAHLAIRALSHAPSWSLRIYGTGPDEGRLRRLVDRLELTTRVTFMGWTPRERLLAEMTANGSVLLFPSLHEEGGWVVQESLRAGLPVVCLDRGGPPELGGYAVSAGGPDETARRLASALEIALRQEVAPDSVRYLQPCRLAIMRILEQRGLWSPSWDL